MKVIVLAGASWLVTLLLVILGTNIGATLWFYMEPVVDSVPQPGSYYVAAGAGFMALLLSFAVSIGLTVQAIQGVAARGSVVAPPPTR